MGDVPTHAQIASLKLEMCSKFFLILVVCLLGCISVACADEQHSIEISRVPEGLIQQDIPASPASKQVLFGGKKVKKFFKKISKGRKTRPSRYWTSANGSRKLRSPGFAHEDQRIGAQGHFHLGPGRRRMGAGFGRRRRTASFKKVSKKTLHKIVIGSAAKELKMKVKPADRKRAERKRKKSASASLAKKIRKELASK